MAIELKKLEDQVIVITGASSGIGLVTARMAAERGARLVLAARSEDALRRLTEEIVGKGGRATPVVADVGDPAGVRAIAQGAIAAYGGFDTWVNNAGVSIYGTIEEVPIEDMRRVFETNVWGLIYGSMEAVAHLKSKGGALINIGSVLSDRAVPLQGIYSASKHAVKGFTDALRMELEQEGTPISVTLVKPGPIDTPYPHHAKNYLDAEPTHVPPVYAPETVARAILHAAETPTRDVFVGGGAKGLAVSGYRAPKLTDKLMEKVFFSGSKSDLPPRPREQNGLDRPAGNLEERGGYEGHTMESSLYTTASLHPLLTGAAVVGTGLAAVGLRRATQNGAASKPAAKKGAARRPVPLRSRPKAEQTPAPKAKKTAAPKRRTPVLLVGRLRRATPDEVAVVASVPATRSWRDAFRPEHGKAAPNGLKTSSTAKG